eukprot:g5859.t1
MFLSAFRTAALRAGHHVRPMNFVRRSFNANSMFLGGSTAIGALAASSLASSTSLCENAKVVKEETRIVANSLHLDDLPDTKIRIFYPLLVDSWYQFLCRILSSFMGMGGFFWHYEIIDTVNDMRIDGRRLKYTGDQMELVMLQFYESMLTIVTLGFRRFLGYTSRAYGRYIDEHLEFRD